MELQAIILYTSLILLCIYLAYKLCLSKTTYKNLPPTPYLSLPLLGHLHSIKPPLHRALHNHSLKYGPIMRLKFGSRYVVIISSSKEAEECFTTNDIVLANRPKLLLAKHLCNDTTIVAAPYGDHWRNLRRNGALKIFSNHGLDLFLATIKDETMHLLRKFSHASSEDHFTKVTLRPWLSDFALNSIMRMVTGKRYYGDGVEEEEEEEEEEEAEEEAGRFKEIVSEVFRLGGASNVEYFMPILNWITSLQGLIEEHRNRKKWCGVEYDD